MANGLRRRVIGNGSGRKRSEKYPRPSKVLALFAQEEPRFDLIGLGRGRYERVTQGVTRSEKTSAARSYIRTLGLKDTFAVRQAITFFLKKSRAARTHATHDAYEEIANQLTL